MRFEKIREMKIPRLIIQHLSEKYNMSYVLTKVHFQSSKAGEILQGAPICLVCAPTSPRSLLVMQNEEYMPKRMISMSIDFPFGAQRAKPNQHNFSIWWQACGAGACQIA